MAADEDQGIPVFTTLEDVYGTGPELESAQQRYRLLNQDFVAVYGKEPELYARAPGSSRVTYFVLV